MTEAMPFLQKYDITFLRPPTIPPGQLFPEEERGENHDDDRAAVVGQRGQAHADELVGLEQEEEQNALGTAGQGQEEKVLFIVMEGDPGPGQGEDGQEAYGTEEEAEKDDLLAGQGDGCRPNTIGAEEKERGEVFEEMRGAHGQDLLVTCVKDGNSVP